MLQLQTIERIASHYSSCITLYCKLQTLTH